MSKQTSYGVCASCGERKTKGGMAAHLKQCLPRTNGTTAAPLMLLRAQAGSGSIFWLNIAVGFDRLLGELDSLLRHVWLECCDHLSEFHTSGRREVSMNSRITQVFGAVGDRINYIYDFGSSTELLISFAGVSEGSAGKPRVVARNEPPVWPCDECGAPSIVLCSDCIYRGTGFCCAAHKSVHECGEDMMLPVVNSPRMGVCGYTGNE